MKPTTIRNATVGIALFAAAGSIAMLDQLSTLRVYILVMRQLRSLSEYHLHPIVDHFTIALLAFGTIAEVFAAATIILSRRAKGWPSVWAQKLRSTSLMLMTTGAVAAVLSYFTGDIEADRLWDTMSPDAQQILVTNDGAGRYLSHAALGHYLMYAFLILAGWRVLMEFSARLSRWRIAFLMAACVAVSGLLYQGKTGGELVYGHGVGISSLASPAQSAERR
jgi:uncharacterized membrane protein